jgi:hypothetical protein
VPRAVLAAPISDFARTVYLWLMDHAGSRGTAWPGVDTLARETRHSPRQVRRALAELRDEGLLSCHHRGLGQTNLYVLQLVAPPPRVAENDRPRAVRNGRSGAVRNGPYGADTDGPLTTTKELPPIERPPLPPVAPPAPPDDDALCERLRAEGVNPTTARRLVRQYPAAAIAVQLDWLPQRPIKTDRAGYLVKAIEGSYLPPGGDPQARLPGEKPPQKLPPPPELGPPPGPESDAARERVGAELREKFRRLGAARIGAAP